MKIEAYQISEVINLKKFRNEYTSQPLIYNNSELFYKQDEDKYCYLLSYGIVVFASFTDLEKSEFLKFVKGYIEDEVSGKYDEHFDLQTDPSVSVVLKYNSITVSEITDDTMIFCEGFNGKFNPYFNYLPFNPVKGEIMDVEIKYLDSQEIINQGVFVIPLGKDTFRLGATYKWDILDFKPTDDGAAVLTEKYTKLMKPSMQILSQQAGVRPATKDRRPFIGMHPKLDNVGIFNGLGSKGVSLAPFFSNQFVDFLVNRKELHPEVNINRFASLYSGY